jgi:hypothetical protein
MQFLLVNCVDFGGRFLRNFRELRGVDNCEDVREYNALL